MVGSVRGVATRLKKHNPKMLMLRGDGFSCMDRVKTELRNRLAISTLGNLLRISLEEPENDAAVRTWGALKDRQFF